MTKISANMDAPAEAASVLRLLAVDDDTQYLELLRERFASEIYQLQTVESGSAALESARNFRPHVVLLDLHLPDMSGQEVLQQLLDFDPAIEVLLITGDYSADAAVAAIRAGASDFLAKPMKFASLEEKLQHYRQQLFFRHSAKNIEVESADLFRLAGLIGKSPVMLDVFSTIRRVAPHFRTALVRGATGTGKELIGNALHELSPAAKGRFIAFNCAALMDSLAESELFGHVKGAFTGAVADRPGIFEAADGGTVFLDEIGELSLQSQAKLLRVLQNFEVTRLGSTIPRKVNVRVIAATHRNLEQMVKEKTFREDLFFRLSVIEIRVPSLLERREDVPLLLRHFLAKYSSAYGKDFAGFTRRAQVALGKYLWPGNVRELEHVVAQATMLAEQEWIDLEDLSERIKQPKLAEVDPELLSLDEVQRRHALFILERVGGNKLRAAEILGVSRTTLYKLIGDSQQED